MNDYSHILNHLERCTPGGRDQTWHACCPVTTKHSNGDRRPSLRLWIDEETGQLRCKCYAGCTWAEIVEALGSKPQAWFPWQTRKERIQKVSAKMGSRIAGVWPYHDRDGQVICEKVRLEGPPPTYEKSYYFRRTYDAMYVRSLAAGHYARHEGVWKQVSARDDGTVDLPEVVPSLYRLPELLDEKRQDQPVIVVEGEKCADLLRELRFVATTGPFGAGRWNFQWGGYLAKRRVAIIPDNDDVGIEYACKVAASAIAYQAESVRVCLWPGNSGLREHDDIVDWMLKYHGSSDLQTKRKAVAEIVTKAPEWKVSG